MNAPQAVSSRYVRNLIVAGRNSNFEIDHIIQRIAATPGGLPCGVYFIAGVKTYAPVTQQEAEGASPESAVARALEAFGVTFR